MKWKTRIFIPMRKLKEPRDQNINYKKEEERSKTQNWQQPIVLGLSERTRAAAIITS